MDPAGGRTRAKESKKIYKPAAEYPSEGQAGRSHKPERDGADPAVRKSPVEPYLGAITCYLACYPVITG